MKRITILGGLTAAAALAFVALPSLAGPKAPATEAAPAQGIIRTVAGTTDWPAKMSPRDVEVLVVGDIATDRETGYVYVSDTARHRIFRIDPAGRTLEPFAGSGIGGFNGDGRRAIATDLHVPTALAVHPKTGDLYVADTYNYRIRAIARDGSWVKTAAGIGVRGIAPEDLPSEIPAATGASAGGFGGDDGPPTAAELNLPRGIAFDADGNLFIADTFNQRVRMINNGTEPVNVGRVRVEPGTIKTILGTGKAGSQLKVEAEMSETDCPSDVELEAPTDDGAKSASSSALLVVDIINQRLLRVDLKTGHVTQEARGKAAGNGPVEGVLFTVEGVTQAPSGDIFYSDIKENAVYRLDMTNYTRERNIPVKASEHTRISGAARLAAGPRGELYVADTLNNVIHKVSDRGREVFAGGARVRENIPATDAIFSTLAPIAVDTDGSLLLGDIFNHVVVSITRSGRTKVIAGSGEAGNSGDGGPPRKASMRAPTYTMVDGDSIYIADPQSHVIRRVVRSAKGARIETFAGNGLFTGDPARSGDGGPATKAEIGIPNGLAKHPKTGEIYFSDVWTATIRKVDSRGIISTVAGRGGQGFAGDGGQALEAQFYWPTGIVFDRDGNLYVTDLFNHRVRLITPDGVVSTIAGTGEKGFSGDGGSAEQARLYYPNAVALDAAGDIYIADSGNHAVRKIDHRTRQISTVVGTGKRGFSGDGGPAGQARLNVPRGLAFGQDGTLYITDSYNGRVRAVRF